MHSTKGWCYYLVYMGVCMSWAGITCWYGKRWVDEPCVWKTDQNKGIESDEKSSFDSWRRIVAACSQFQPGWPGGGAIACAVSLSLVAPLAFRMWCGTYRSSIYRELPFDKRARRALLRHALVIFFTIPESFFLGCSPCSPELSLFPFGSLTRITNPRSIYPFCRALIIIRDITKLQFC